MYRSLIAVLCVVLVSCQKDLPDTLYTKLNVPINMTYRDVHVFNENNLIVCGGNDHGAILKSNDRGATWVESQTFFDNPVNALFFLNENTGYCADSDILIYKTTDGGVTWNPFYASEWPLTVNRNLRDIWFKNSDQGFICGGKNYENGVLYRTHNAGSYWSFEEFSHEYRGICFADDAHGVMCGYGSLLITSDGGNTFSSKKIKDYYYTAICVDSSGKFYMTEFNGSAYTSVDFGNTWEKIHDGDAWIPSNKQLFTIAVSPSGKIAAAGPNGYLIIKMDGGTEWQRWETYNNSDILKVAWLDDNNLLAVGKAGVFLTTF